MEEHIEVQTQAQAAAAASSAQDFDALLREKDFQSEFDRRVSRALEAARGRWAQETERKLEQARAEAEAMARMSGEERMAHDYARREAELQAREAEIGRRELRAEAARLLQERALPAELMDALNYDSAEGVARSVDAAERAFREAMQQGVRERMRGMTPVKAHAACETDSDDAYYRARFALHGAER